MGNETVKNKGGERWGQKKKQVSFIIIDDLSFYIEFQIVYQHSKHSKQVYGK